jgi:orotate phosphoribosyltransferase
MVENVLELLSARKGHFLLESGHHGDLWLDLETLFLRPLRVKNLAVKGGAKPGQCGGVKVGQ